MSLTVGCPACSDVPHGNHNTKCRKREQDFNIKQQKAKEAKLMDEEEYDEEELWMDEQMEDMSEEEE
eukprot:8663954-Heterocapsa_arctica.AAC.1